MKLNRKSLKGYETLEVYVIITISLVSLLVIFYGLSEYRGWITEKRQDEINARPFEVREERAKKAALNLKIINKTIDEAKQKEFKGL